MGCYYCWKKNSLRIDDNGTCTVCGKAACAPPPIRPDGRFHGDACAVVKCGQFLCLPHMHRHSDEATGVSGMFPQAALALSVAAIATTAQLEDSETPSSELRKRPAWLKSLVEFLNYITPGTTPLMELQDVLPAHVTEVTNDDTGHRWMLLKPEFFRREVTEMVARMALRSFWVAGSALGARKITGTKKLFLLWTESLGTANLRQIAPIDVDADWLISILQKLPKRRVSVRADIADLPAEAKPRRLVRELVQRYEEGEEATGATAEA